MVGSLGTPELLVLGLLLGLVFAVPAIVLWRVASARGLSHAHVWWASLGWLGLLIGILTMSAMSKNMADEPHPSASRGEGAAKTRWTVGALVAGTLVMLAVAAAWLAVRPHDSEPPIPAQLIESLIEGQAPRGMGGGPACRITNEAPSVYRADCSRWAFIVNTSTLKVVPADASTQSRWNLGLR